MSIESVAATAGVGKTTIYRRYLNKRELVVGAVLSIADTLDLPPDSGSVRTDLLDVVHQAFGIFHNGFAFSMMGTLLVKERDDPELIDLFRRKVILPRMEIMGQVFRRAIDRGEVRGDISVPLVVQLLAGALFARHISGYPEDEAWIRELIDTILQGIAVRQE
jgi:AcrR family transcriptional regulator